MTSTTETCPRCGKTGPDDEKLYHYSDCPWAHITPGLSEYELKRRMKRPYK